MRRRSMSRRRRRRLTRTICIAVLLSVTSYAVVSSVTVPRSRSRSEAIQRRKAPSGKTGITAVGKHVAPRSANLFVVPSVATYLASCRDDITAAVYDDSTGYTSIYRPGVTEDTASIMKVDILATLLAQIQAEGSVLTTEEQELSEEMIEESDNDAAQDLWDSEGGATAVTRFNAEAGLTQTVPDAAGYWGLSTTTATDQVQLLKKVAFANTLLTDASRSYELGLMTHVDPSQAWGVSAGVAPSVTVALKNGWLPLDTGGWQVNSIGYVDGDGRDYVIAVLTNGNATEADGISTIEDLSGLIWQELAP